MTREELEHLAAEYVLGVLEGHDAALAEHMDATDAAFAEAAAAWRERLREVDETAPPAPVPGTLWNAITQSLKAPVAMPARVRPVILADAGVLRGRRAAGQKSRRAQLLEGGAEFVDEPIVVSGRIITARSAADAERFVQELLRS